MPEEVLGKRTADPIHTIPYPSVKDELEHEDKHPQESETGEHLHAHGYPNEGEHWLGEEPESFISDPRNSPLFPPSKEEREYADENPPFPTQEIPDESAPAVVGHGLELTARQEAPSSYRDPRKRE